MPVYALGNARPSLAPSCFVVPSAVIVGNVTIGERSSVWFNSVIRADDDTIEIGEETNIQDLCMVHVGPRLSRQDRKPGHHRASLRGPRMHHRGRLSHRHGGRCHESGRDRNGKHRGCRGGRAGKYRDSPLFPGHGHPGQGEGHFGRGRFAARPHPGQGLCGQNRKVQGQEKFRRNRLNFFFDGGTETRRRFDRLSCL